jgi:hypothetical protein
MIKITQGDTAVLNFTATDGQGAPIDLTGASFTTTMVGLDGAIVSFPNNQHVANPDQVNFRGQFTLTLSIDDTMQLRPNNFKDVVTQIVQSASTIYYHGNNILSVLVPIPLT